jgi:DNA-binding LacI/PurR family transcriptional regulator
VPLIAVDSSGRSGFHSVAIDQYRGARAAVAHLAELGHTRILHLAGPADSTDATERVRGWRDELAARGLVAVEPMVGDWSPASGFEFGTALAGQGAPLDFTAVFASNDQMALGLVHALAGHGFTVPDDVSVIGFDDIPESAFFAPPLTTMRQDFDSLGRDILFTLLAVLADEDSSGVPPMVPELVVRASTAPPRASAAPTG